MPDPGVRTATHDRSAPPVRGARAARGAPGGGAPGAPRRPVPAGEGSAGSPLAQLFATVASHREAGRSIVAVQGLGFLGTAVATAVAAARREDGEPRHAVIGVELPTPVGSEKIARLNTGHAPAPSPDPELASVLRDAVLVVRNLWGTTHAEALGLADVVVVDVPLDARLDAHEPGMLGGVQLGLGTFETAIRAIGRHMRADALVLVETTVPVGTCARVAVPLLQEERTRRGIRAPLRLAHACERVTAGMHHLRSVRHFWRVFSGVDAESAERASEFLASFTDTERFPLRQLDGPPATELAKLLESSYRAVTIALTHEWTLLAEAAGIDLFAVVEAIRMRRGTHDNMRTPGLGVGGYCLPRDALLAQWSAERVYALDAPLALSLHALGINQRMPLHTVALAREVCSGTLEAVRVLVCGVTYLPEVPDTRNSPTEVLVDGLASAGARVTVHDPYVAAWTERPAVRMVPELEAALADADVVVLATCHAAYRALGAEGLLAHPRLRAVVDACDAVPDAAADRLRRDGRRVVGVGKGHWRARGYQCAP